MHIVGAFNSSTGRSNTINSMHQLLVLGQMRMCKQCILESYSSEDRKRFANVAISIARGFDILELIIVRTGRVIDGGCSTIVFVNRKRASVHLTDYVYTVIQYYSTIYACR